MGRAVDNPKRYVSVAEYQRMTGLSYPTVKKAITSGELKAVKTEAGHYRIDMQAENADYSAILERLDRQEQKLDMFFKHFGFKP